MEHKQFFSILQERLGKDKKGVDALYSGLLQIIKEPPRIVLTFKPGAVLKNRIKENSAR